MRSFGDFVPYMGLLCGMHRGGPEYTHIFDLGAFHLS
jgi:hypothetical protein